MKIGYIITLAESSEQNIVATAIFLLKSIILSSFNGKNKRKPTATRESHFLTAWSFLPQK